MRGTLYEKAQAVRKAPGSVWARLLEAALLLCSRDVRDFVLAGHICGGTLALYDVER